MIDNQSVFLTGGSGFVGQHLIDELVKNNFQVFVLSRKARTSSSAKVHFVQGDLFHLKDLSPIISSCHYFIHAAGEKKVETQMRQTNVEAVDEIIKLLSNFPEIKFIQVSSSGIYGIEKHPLEKINEESPILPNNTYEKTKYEAELLIQKSALKFIIVRPSNIFGENDESYKLLNLIRAINSGKFFYIKDEAVVNYIYVGTFAKTIVALMNNADFKAEIFNLNCPVTMGEFGLSISKALSKKKAPAKLPSLWVPLLYLGCKVSDFLPKKYQYLNSGKYRELSSKKFYTVDKIKSILSFNPKLELEQGIKNIVLYYKNKKLL